jgi:signal transduction histidine kinase
MSHDVRASVRALIELPQWIEEDLADLGVKLNEPVKESIALMHVHTSRLDRMLVDLLAFSRVGRSEPPREVAVDLALTEVLEEMHIPTGFAVETDLLTNRLFVSDTDAQMLLRQLVSNAVKHHDGLTGRIRVSLHETGGFSLLNVADDGPGIEPAFHEKVFSAMTTLKPRDEVEGSGMGLAIVRKIARHYGGRILLSSGHDGRGTTVEVAIPTPKS